jgi:hypothetical protein
LGKNSCTEYEYSSRSDEEGFTLARSGKRLAGIAFGYGPIPFVPRRSESSLCRWLAPSLVVVRWGGNESGDVYRVYTI